MKRILNERSNMSLHSQVESIISANSFAREYDDDLLVAYWERNGLELSTRQKYLLVSLSNPSSVLRARRELLQKFPRTGSVKKLPIRLGFWLKLRMKLGL